MTKRKLIVPQIALLGICHRARCEQGDPPEFSQMDILGLRRIVLPYIYPFDVSSHYLVLAVYCVELSKTSAVALRDGNGNQVFRIDISAQAVGEIVDSKDKKADTPESGVLVSVSNEGSWTMVLVPLNGLVLNEPQTLEAFLLDGESEISIGVLAFGLASVPPLTPDRMAAIKSDPRAIKALHFNIGCKHCDSKLKVFAALEKPEDSDTGLVWYQDVPEVFECGCGKTRLSLNILRTNMHALLGNRDVIPKNLSFSDLYEHRAIDLISKELLHLFNTKPREEEVQQFLSKNPIVFHFLSPLRLYEKPPILSKHKADFAILDSRGVLVFVEIERPDILLIRKDGAASAEMEHAISQVRDWLYLYEKHRGAVLECLDLGDREVTKVRGLVIAGRHQGYNTEKLRRFKWQDRGAIDCMTYDDLLSILAALDRDIKAM